MVWDEPRSGRAGASVTAYDALRREFDAVLRDLEKVRRESEATHRQLVQRNRELTAIAAVAQATSSDHLDLAGTLQRALQVVLEVIGLSVGWILLLPKNGAEPQLADSIGLPRDMLDDQIKLPCSECPCAQVLDTRRPLLVDPLPTYCPIRSLDLGQGRRPTCHAAVPLLTRSEVLGVLNLTGQKPLSLDSQELDLLGAIGRQVGVAIENARLWEELKQRDALRSQLLESAIAAQEDERRRIARALHDQTGQGLTSLLVWLRALEAEADGSPKLVVSPAQLQELKAIVADTLDRVRDLALELRPSVLDDLGLVPALQRMVRVCHERHHLAVDFQTVALEGVRIPAPIETALYRIAQEALTNVVQHAGADQASLLMEARAGAIVLIVEDDGSGFPVSRLMNGPLNKHWLGLHGMRERAELIGGRLVVESAPAMGTAVYVEVPLPGQHRLPDE